MRLAANLVEQLYASDSSDTSIPGTDLGNRKKGCEVPSAAMGRHVTESRVERALPFTRLRLDERCKFCGVGNHVSGHPSHKVVGERVLQADDLRVIPTKWERGAMRRNILIGIGALIATSAYAGEAEKFFSERVNDFGTVPFGPTLVHHFKVTNTSNHTVQIRGSRVSCGCVSTHVHAYTLQPGESTYVTANMDTKRFVGQKEVIVYVSFSQPYEEVALSVKANRNDFFSKSADVLSMGQVRRGVVGNGAIQVTMRNDANFEIKGAASSTDFVRASFRLLKRDRAEVVYEVSADLKAGLDVGSWTTDILFTTNNASVGTIRIPVNVDIVAPITATPATVQFPPIKVGDKKEMSVVVKGDKPFRIIDVKGGDDLVSAEADNREAKQAHIVRLIFRPNSAGEHAKTITVVTDTGAEGKIQIPVKGRARVEE